MRLLVDAVAASAGGAGLTRVRELVHDLPLLAPDHEYIFVMRRELARQVALPNSAPVAKVALWFPPRAAHSLPARIAWEQLLLPIAARRFSPDAVFSPFNVLPLVWPYPRPLLAVMVSNLAPFAEEVLEICRPGERLRNEILRRMTSWSVSRADLVLLQSQRAHHVLGRGKLDGKAETVPHSLPRIDWAVGTSESAGVDRPYFVVVSDLYKFKGIETVVRAVRQFPPDARPLIHVCGRPLEADYAADLVRQVSECGVQDSVRFRGHLDHRDLMGLLMNARACVAPSRFENLSRVPGEALAAGTPVIASDIPSFREACGDAALFFPVGDHRQLVRCMTAVMEDDDLRRRLVAQCRRHLARQPPGQASERILQLIEGLVEARSPRIWHRGAPNSDVA